MTEPGSLPPEIFSFFDNTPDLVAFASREGYFQYVNEAVVNTLGYTREELFARPISDFINPEDKPRTALTRNEMLQGKALVNFENRYITKSGALVWLHWTSIYLADKKLVFALAKNITARKLEDLDQEMRYRKFENLASHFKERLEGDKKILATELHEEWAQMASAIKMEINWLAQLPGLDDTARNRASRTMSLLDILINSIRRISYAISPTMLDDLGLNETLQWLCDEFTRQHGIPCFYESAIDDAMLSHELQLDLFRICQDALNNVSQHAEANSVTVHLEGSPEEVCLTVADDGKGFDTGKTKIKTGLTSMRERAASVNGKVAVDSKPGEGTSICVKIALVSDKDIRKN